MMTFAEALKYGRQREHLVAFALRERKFFTQELAAINEPNGGGPRAHGPYGVGIVLPDLLVSGKGKTFPFEVKAKGEATFTKTTCQLEHGIGQRLYLHYRAYQRETGLRVVLGIFEEDTGELLVRSLDKLKAPRAYHGNKMDPGGMFFWPRDAFRVFAQVAPPTDVPLFRDVPMPPTLPPINDLGDA
jgi:hypothetical protein